MAATGIAHQANVTADLHSLCPPTAALCVMGLLNPAMGDHPERTATLRVLSLKWASQVLPEFLTADEQGSGLKS